MCGRIAKCKCIKSCNKITYFCFKTKPNREGNIRIFLLYSVIFFTKFEQYNMAFQSLFSKIIRIWELFFRSVGSFFSFKLFTYNEKLLFHLVETNFFFNYQYILSVYIVGKAGFSPTHGNKRISNRNLVLMLHIFQQRENKIINLNLIPSNGNRLSIQKEPSFLPFISS